MSFQRDHLPKPIRNADARFYWDMAHQEKLFIRHCRSCEKTHFMPRYLCPFCWSSDLDWLEASGRGVVHAFTIIHRASLPVFQPETPYVLALIELEEGPRMMANILGEDALSVAINDPVKVVFETRGSEKLPQFIRAY